jgi:hypothetical protein
MAKWRSGRKEHYRTGIIRGVSRKTNSGGMNEQEFLNSGAKFFPEEQPNAYGFR